jgi:hypothetical protein
MNSIVDMVNSYSVRTCQFHGGRTDQDGFLVFCGKPVREGSSYCPEHYRRIYQRAPGILTPREPAAEPAAEEVVEAAEAAPTPELEVEGV